MIRALPAILKRLATPALGLAAVVAAPGLSAQTTPRVPPVFQGVDIIEHLDELLPLNVPFVDETGKAVTVGDFFDGERPVIVTLNYYRCPMLCVFQLNNLLDVVKNMELTLGDEFRMVTISIDPNEGPELAGAKAKNYLGSYNRPVGEDGWKFLTGRDPDIREIADAIGFGYRWVEEKQEWAHTAAIFICTPDGRISRYLYGMNHEPEQVRLALLEASEGKIGTTVDRFLLWCLHYDDKTGQYTTDVMKLVRVFGLATVFTLGTIIFILWRRDPLRTAGGPTDVAGLQT